MSTSDENTVLQILLANRALQELFEGLVRLDLPNWIIVAGCLFQTVWNVKTGRPVAHGIDDYDVFYFDKSDTSFEAEDLIIRQVDASFPDFPARIEVRNQARVHLWYPEKFGHPYPPLTSSFEGVDRFLHASCAIGLYADGTGAPRLYAPFGLSDLLAMRLRANPWNKGDARRQEKEAKWRKFWPELEVVG
ncbi:MAG: nucleotidyltransferase family protein [Alphaproteobacteria bacterium]|nr:MAG: nucleotidyltransferase family protein [Alphaproteobacteria bacterium]